MVSRTVCVFPSIERKFIDAARIWRPFQRERSQQKCCEGPLSWSLGFSWNFQRIDPRSDGRPLQLSHTLSCSLRRSADTPPAVQTFREVYGSRLCNTHRLTSSLVVRDAPGDPGPVSCVLQQTLVTALVAVLISPEQLEPERLGGRHHHQEGHQLFGCQQ